MHFCLIADEVNSGRGEGRVLVGHPAVPKFQLECKTAGGPRSSRSGHGIWSPLAPSVACG